MGQVVAYLIANNRDQMPLRLVSIDPRGPGPVAWSPFFLTVAVIRVVLGAKFGNLGLLHLHVAERASLVRKGIVAAVARRLGVPVLLHLHAAEIQPFYERLPRLAQLAVGRMFRQADLCVVLGTGWRDWLSETMGVSPARIAVLRNGVPQLGGRRDAPAPTARAARFHILFLGNLTPRKGVADLLTALADPVLAGCDFEAVFAGGGDSAPYRRQAASLGLAPRVSFTGWVDRARASSLTRAADVLVLPSYHEGLPLVVLEALEAGTPVVCTPVGSIPEVLADQQTALFVPPGGCHEIATALRRLIDDRALAGRLAAAGQALYQREFTMDAFVTSLAALYRRVAMADAA